MRTAFATFLMLNDNYLPGCLVLAGGLRRPGVGVPLVVLVTDDVSQGRLAAALYNRYTVDSGDNAYLGTFTFRASDDAAGGFDVSIRTNGTTLADADQLDIAAGGASTSIRVGSVRSQRSKASRRR